MDKGIRFDGKTALVTGAGKGIGRETVKALVKCGADVIALTRNQTDLDTLQKELPQIRTVYLDVRDWDRTRKVVSDLGPVDLLVNNAGVYRKIPFLDVTKEQFHEVFETNIISVFNITQIIAREMVKNDRGGVIVNLSSILGQRAFAQSTVYCATKGAIEMFTKALSVDLGKHKIRVNTVEPTVTITSMVDPLLVKDPAFNDMYLPRHTAGRYTETEDIVNAIIFLLSDKASMIHGTSLAVDAGFLAW